MLLAAARRLEGDGGVYENTLAKVLDVSKVTVSKLAKQLMKDYSLGV